MIQAIVFLPLLGAILAGIIAIAGAHARNPSGLEMDHGGHGHGHDAHGHDAHASQAHAAHGHDDHGHDHPAEPPARQPLWRVTRLLKPDRVHWQPAAE